MDLDKDIWVVNLVRNIFQLINLYFPILKVRILNINWVGRLNTYHILGSYLVSDFQERVI